MFAKQNNVVNFSKRYTLGYQSLFDAQQMYIIIRSLELVPQPLTSDSGLVPGQVELVPQSLTLHWSLVLVQVELMRSL